MKKLSLVMAAAAMTATLTACPGKTVPEAPQPSELKGQVSVLEVTPLETTETFDFSKKAWSAGQQEVQLHVLSAKTAENLEAEVENLFSDKPLATGRISANGQLSLKLPESVPATMLSSNMWDLTEDFNAVLAEEGSCTGAALNVTDKNAQIGTGIITVKSQDSILLAGPQPVYKYENMKLTGSVEAGTIIYADRATKATGSVTCTFDSDDADNVANDAKLTYTINLDLKRGWNTVVMSGQGEGHTSADQQDLDSGSATLTVSTKELPGEWMMPKIIEGATPLSLKDILN